MAAPARPVKGWEYFDASCLALILDVADSWLNTASALVKIASITEITWVQDALFAA